MPSILYVYSRGAERLDLCDAFRSWAESNNVPIVGAPDAVSGPGYSFAVQGALPEPEHNGLNACYWYPEGITIVSPEKLREGSR